jgi:ATP-dependent DNA helicase RecQ
VLLGSAESLLGQHRQLLEDLAEAKLIGALAVDEAHCVMKYGYSRKTKSGKKKKAFRPAYSRLLELRAIVGDVPIVALTATATPDVQNKLIKELSMAPCFSIVLPPQKDNIKYMVHRLDKKGNLYSYFGWLRKAIEDQAQDMTKTLVFFHSVAKQSLVYEFLDDELKEVGHKGDPPHNDATHYFEMYHMKTDDTIKDSILAQFSKKDGHMRCVLASSSFSMGLNIPDITNVIHFGPAMDLDDFLQETGRASRTEGSKAVSIMLLYPGCLNGCNVSASMKDYITTKSCRRITLLKYFGDAKSVEPKHDCCDNCAMLCSCGECPASPLKELGILGEEEDDDSEAMDDSSDGSSDTPSNHNSNSDSDSDMEVYRRKPLLILSDSE